MTCIKNTIYEIVNNYCVCRVGIFFKIARLGTTIVNMETICSNTYIRIKKKLKWLVAVKPNSSAQNIVSSLKPFYDMGKYNIIWVPTGVHFYVFFFYKLYRAYDNNI